MSPNLFLIIGEVLNYIIRKAMKEGGIMEVKLLGGKQQCILQYADDSSFLIGGDQSFANELVRLLEIFSLVSGI